MAWGARSNARSVWRELCDLLSARSVQQVLKSLPAMLGIMTRLQWPSTGNSLHGAGQSRGDGNRRRRWVSGRCPRSRDPVRLVEPWSWVQVSWASTSSSLITGGLRQVRRDQQVLSNRSGDPWPRVAWRLSCLQTPGELGCRFSQDAALLA